MRIVACFEHRYRFGRLTRLPQDGLVVFATVSQAQKYRLRSAGYKRDIVAEVEPGDRYVDRESGTDFVVVGEVLPGAASGSDLPWSPENLRLCGCSREQLVQNDVNDCPYCDRRIPAGDSAPDAG
jgi:hypothetical protein